MIFSVYRIKAEYEIARPPRFGHRLSAEQKSGSGLHACMQVYIRAWCAHIMYLCIFSGMFILKKNRILSDERQAGRVNADRSISSQYVPVCAHI